MNHYDLSRVPYSADLCMVEVISSDMLYILIAANVSIVGKT